MSRLAEITAPDMIAAGLWYLVITLPSALSDVAKAIREGHKPPSGPK